jgi:hypothetical protein
MPDESPILSPSALNDEQPSPDDMARLTAALHARPPRPLLGSAGSCRCLRCGWRWEPRRPDPPRQCPNRKCHSAYWNIPPQRANARRPESTDLDKMRRQIARDRKLDYREAQLRRLEARMWKLGITLQDLQALRRVRDSGRGQGQEEAVAPAPMALPVDPNLYALPQPLIDAIQRQRSPTHIASYRPTVPPPPGLDDLEPRKE